MSETDLKLPVVVENEWVSESSSSAADLKGSTHDGIKEVLISELGLTEDEVCCSHCDTRVNLLRCDECDGGKIVCQEHDQVWHKHQRWAGHSNKRLIVRHRSVNTSTTPGAQGYSPDRAGIQGHAPARAGIQGYSPDRAGIQGYSPDRAGIQGHTPARAGIQEYSPDRTTSTSSYLSPKTQSTQRSTSADSTLNESLKRVKYPPNHGTPSQLKTTTPKGPGSTNSRPKIQTASSLERPQTAYDTNSLDRQQYKNKAAAGAVSAAGDGEHFDGRMELRCERCTLINVVNIHVKGLKLCELCETPLPMPDSKSDLENSSIDYDETLTPTSAKNLRKTLQSQREDSEDLTNFHSGSSGSGGLGDEHKRSGSFSFRSLEKEIPDSSFLLEQENSKKSANSSLKSESIMSRHSVEQENCDQTSLLDISNSWLEDNTPEQITMNPSSNSLTLAKTSSSSMGTLGGGCVGGCSSHDEACGGSMTHGGPMMRGGFRRRSGRSDSVLNKDLSIEDTLKQLNRESQRLDVTSKMRRLQKLLMKCVAAQLTHEQVVELLRQCPTDHEPQDYLTGLTLAFENVHEEALRRGTVPEGPESHHDVMWALLGARGNPQEALQDLVDGRANEGRKTKPKSRVSFEVPGLEGFEAYVGDDSMGWRGCSRQQSSASGYGDDEGGSLPALSIGDEIKRSVSMIDDLIVTLKSSSSGAEPDPTNPEYRRKVRMIMCECGMSWARSRYVLDTLLDPSLADLLDFNDIVAAAREAKSKTDLKSKLLEDCEICYDSFPRSQIRSLSDCHCKICLQCVVSHFEVVIRERYVRNLVCPVCQKPEITDCNSSSETHFQFLSYLLHSVLSHELYELFQTKLRDWNLMMDPLFRWCPNSACKMGFLIASERTLRVRCIECRKEMCQKCMKPWEDQHTNLTCDEFHAWKDENSPERQALGLARHLEENGIECPQCKCRYSLAKGGCMHFTCIQCRYDFCSGCSRAFRHSGCNEGFNCNNRGLHCHHPRNCLFYLRDYQVTRLQKLLKNHSVAYNTVAAARVGSADDPSGGGLMSQSVCSVMEQKQTTDGFIDEACGKVAPQDFAGLCEVHYKEYLVSLINRANIDPAEEMDVKEMENVMNRVNKNTPARNYPESDEQYRLRLLQVIKIDVPLAQRIGVGSSIRLSGINETTTIEGSRRTGAANPYSAAASSYTSATSSHTAAAAPRYNVEMDGREEEVSDLVARSASVKLRDHTVVRRRNVR